MIDKMKNRIAGALYGVAVGDALGGPVEFMGPDQIAAKYGHLDRMVGGGWLSLKPGEITDDTQMTLCVAEGIVEDPEEPIEAIGRRFIAWADSGPKDVGAACAASIWNAQKAGGPSPSLRQWNDAAFKYQHDRGKSVEGNGALMRTVYPGLYYRECSTAERIAMRVGQMTHAGYKSTEACILYARMINLLTASESQAQDTLPPYHFLAECCNDYSEYYAAAIADVVEPARGGWVVDSMRIALGCVATSRSFARAVTKAVNLGGDADTNGAITGGLAGAWYGFDAIPVEWIAALAPDVRDTLDRLANEAYNARRG